MSFQSKSSVQCVIQVEMFFFYLLVILYFVHRSSCLIQGTPVFQADARFVASVRLRRDEERSFGSGYLCTATIINNWNVVTTASCVDRWAPGDLIVAMGNVDLTRRGFISNVQRIIIHENYTDTFSSNIAVLSLSANFRQNSRRRYRRNMNTHIQPIGLDNSPPIQNETCSFFAWGNNNILGNNNTLLGALLPLWDRNICGNFSSGRFCAGNVNNGPSLCYRNLGGPFICKNRLTGIAIDDTGCGRPGTNGQFHSISHYHEWILQASHANLEIKPTLCMFLIVFLLNKL